jgi:hypothetical protein
VNLENNCIFGEIIICPKKFLYVWKHFGNPNAQIRLLFRSLASGSLAPQQLNKYGLGWFSRLTYSINRLNTPSFWALPMHNEIGFLQSMLSFTKLFGYTFIIEICRPWHPHFFGIRAFCFQSHHVMSRMYDMTSRVRRKTRSRSSGAPESESRSLTSEKNMENTESYGKHGVRRKIWKTRSPTYCQREIWKTVIK